VSDELLTVRQVAEMLRVAPKTVRRWISEGQLPASRATETANLRIARREVEKRLNVPEEPAVPQSVHTDDPGEWETSNARSLRVRSPKAN
jgi:excisionase family DNA binding protein